MVKDLLRETDALLRTELLAVDVIGVCLVAERSVSHIELLLLSGTSVSLLRALPNDGGRWLKVSHVAIQDRCVWK